MQRAKEYLEQFREASTSDQRQAVVDAYRSHYETLTNEERARADEVMRVLWPSIEEEIDELEPLMQRLDALSRKQAITHTA